MATREIKVAVIQKKTMPGSSKEEKLDHILPLIEQAAKEGSKIIMPGELCTSDYEKFYTKDVALFEEAETIPGPTTEAVGALAKKYGVYVVFPMFERKAPGIYFNSAAVVGPSGSVVGNYRKTHVAGVQVLEKLYFRNGQKFEVWETEFEPNARIGIIICHDRRYPETSRIVAKLGAEIMLCPDGGARVRRGCPLGHCQRRPLGGYRDVTPYIRTGSARSGRRTTSATA